MNARLNLPPPQFIKLANGITLPYVEQGAHDGLPVILLHGYTDSWRSWQRVLPHLQSWLHTYAISQRGHGAASIPPSGYGPRDMAKDVVAFMDALGIERAVIVGHSMGSVVAQHFAAANPTRMLGMVLIGAMRGYSGNPVIEELAAAIATINGAPDEAFVREFQKSTLAQPVPDDFFADIMADSLAVLEHVWRESMAAFLATPPAEGMDAPTLIVWGDQDAVCAHADQLALVEVLPDVHLRVYRGAGHGLHWEQPERFAADLSDFCDMTSLQALPARRAA
jgi:non-heme chloroperoxidase